MPSTATLAQLADIDDPINGLGTAGGDIVRDRWNQIASVEVSDMADSIFVSKSLGNIWRQGKAKLGTNTGNGSGSAGSTWVIPQ